MPGDAFSGLIKEGCSCAPPLVEAGRAGLEEEGVATLGLAASAASQGPGPGVQRHPGSREHERHEALFSAGSAPRRWLARGNARVGVIPRLLVGVLTKIRGVRAEVLSMWGARRCDARLVRALEEMRVASSEDLRRVEYVESLVGRAGLAHDDRGIYGEDARWMNPVPRGLWQIPRQLAELLVWLSHRNVRTFLEIRDIHRSHVCGDHDLPVALPTRPGGYLTVDPARRHRLSGLTPRYFRARYARGTSDDFAGRSFDFCFIDGDHRYGAVARDFRNVGRYARICAFHDINDELSASFAGNDGGVVRFWGDLVTGIDPQRVRTFCYHSEGRRVMGIGAIEAGD